MQPFVHDLVIRGAEVVDGTGAPPLLCDVAVSGARIAVVGDYAAHRAGREIDGSGRTLVPGFIDVHAHDDFAVVGDPNMACKVGQGVTTCVVGNCGIGAAPLDTARSSVQALFGSLDLPEWDGYGGYLRYLDHESPSVNVAALIGHRPVRMAVMGDNARHATSTEIGQMRRMVDEGMEAGAVGLSSGLAYEPGRYAAPDELVALCVQFAGTGARYTTHLRDEGRGLLSAVREALTIAERAGVGVQISHHKAAGRDNWGLVRRSLALLEQARSRGVDVAADQYPYTAASTVLTALVEQHAFTRGGGFGRVDPDDVVIASTLARSEWEGRSLSVLATESGVTGEEIARRVRDADPATNVVFHIMAEDDVRTVLAHPTTMIGSDGIPTAGGKPHPRLFGTFPRVLGRYARDLGVLQFEEAVRRMTSYPAKTFGLIDRGVIRPGAFADLVLLDRERIVDRATYDEPRQSPLGIDGVWLNGIEVIHNGVHTGARPGRTLRRSGS